MTDYPLDECHSLLISAKRLAKQALYVSRFYHLLRTVGRIRQGGARLIILVYHNVTEERDYLEHRPHHFQIRPDITDQVLGQQLRILKTSYPVISLDEGVSRLARDDLSEDAVAITFDDGYRSFKHLAFPILKSLGLPATMFLASDFVGTKGFYWWDELNQIVFLLRTTCDDPERLKPILGNQQTDLWNESRTDLGATRQFLSQLESSLRYTPKAQRSDTIQALRELLPPAQQEQLKPEEILSWDDIRELTPHFISWGSHTCSHCGFADEDSKALQTEVEESKLVIEKHTSTPVTSFAYPYGGDGPSYQKSTAMLRLAGYESARTMLEGFNDASTNCMLLKAAVISTHSDVPMLIRRDLKLDFVRSYRR